MWSGSVAALRCLALDNLVRGHWGAAELFGQGPLPRPWDAALLVTDRRLDEARPAWLALESAAHVLASWSPRALGTLKRPYPRTTSGCEAMVWQFVDLRDESPFDRTVEALTGAMVGHRAPGALASASQHGRGELTASWSTAR
jgi:hypothetical protein